MAGFSNVSELASEDAPPAGVLRATTAVVIRKSLARPTLSPGHAAILEMHENSQTNALIYIAVVLSLYVLGITLVIIKYLRTERYEARLGRLLQDLVHRDPFLRLSRRHSTQPKTSPTPEVFSPEDPPLARAVQIPEIRVPKDDLDQETKV